MFDTLVDGELNEAQADAVEHGRGPLLIVAGAGTGKTRTLTSRVAALLERGVRPERLLLLTFTRRAAADMMSRAAELCGDRDAPRRMWGGTFHAIAHRLVVEHADTLGLAEVSLLDPADVVDLLDLIRDEHGLADARTRLPTAQTLADIVSRSVNTHRPAREVIAVDFPQYQHAADQVMPLLTEFMARKRAAGLLDFDDLLLAWRALLAAPEVGDRMRARWDHVLVDEYQDVNQIQVDIVRTLRPDGQGLTVVGDDAQAVYGFRGASGSHLFALASTYPDTTVVRLQTNFRSLQPLLDLANVVRPAGDATQRITLRAARESAGAPRPVLRICYDADEQARAVADAVLAAREDGLDLRRQAVLMRAGSHSRELELELAARKVPYVKYGGLRFIETAHVKDFLAALRLARNPRDELACFRLLKLHRYIGKAHARALATILTGTATEIGDSDTAGWNVEVRARTVEAGPEKARRSLAATLDGLHAAAQAEPAERVRACLDITQPLIRVHYDDAALRLDDLDRLATAAASSSDLVSFLAELTLDPAGATTDFAKPPHIDDDYLTLSTVHSAKGLEWETVHLIHASDGSFPSDMALTDPTGLEEEQRLFYVAVTRARQQLTMYQPQRLHVDRVRDRHVYSQTSRFLDTTALATVDTVHPDRPRSTTRPGVLPGGPRVEVPSLGELFA
jgi:DNA helicase II / ATP-dependent DNA helicase PcrA